MPSNATVSPEDLLAAEQLAAFTLYVQNKIETLWIVLLVTYLALCGMCLALIIYLHRNRSGARRGDSSAARKIVLPAFEPLLWILCCATGLCSIYFVITIITSAYPMQIPSIQSECFYAGRQVVLLLVIVFMLQKSVTLPALRRAVLITFGLSIYTIPVVYYMTKHNEPSRTHFNFCLYSIVHALNIPIFVYVLVKPPVRASKAALRQYCVFAIVQQVLEFSNNLAFYHLKVDLCFNIAYSQLAIGCMVPLFIWRVLKADTEHWRGLGQRACALQNLFRQRANVNERISSQGLHVLIEMHRKYIIDFAYLELRRRIGVGSSAVVYSGTLNSKTQVAIKVYTPTAVTEDTVAEFSHEAALCGALNHPNIVKFFGMCVCPPTICLVSELCQGSLDVVTASLAKRHREPRRQQFLINLGYMIDAARAVAYIHSFSPAFVHRDIKPGNFLVDLEGNVKLTDFGESRSLPSVNLKMANEASDGSARARESVRMSSHGTEGYMEFQSVRNSEIKTLGSLSHTPVGESRSRSVKMTVKGTADYMAPEMINGKGGFAAYGEAADVYSLAVTMWDILHPDKEKYPAPTTITCACLGGIFGRCMWCSGSM
ncbi:Tkl/drk protein kinase, partial [Globisporangium splendens]